MTKSKLKEKMEEMNRIYGNPYSMEGYTVSELLSIATDIDVEVFDNVQTDLVCETPLDCIYNDPTAVKTTAKKSFKLRAVMELAKRMAIERTSKNIEAIHGPEDVASFLAPRLSHERQEHFVALLLNTKNRILAYEVITVGSLNASVVHPRDVFKAAISHNAATVIVAHNHPSGDPKPSREDIAVTQRLVKVGRVMDIPILDHIIIGKDRYISLKEQGMLA